MDYDISSLLDLSTFTNYGANLEKEIQAEVFLALLTEKKETRYFNQFGTTLKRRENTPITIQRMISLGVEIVDSVETYNQNAPVKYERRVSVPFENIEFDDTNKNIGGLSARVLYYRLKDLKTIEVTA